MHNIELIEQPTVYETPEQLIAQLKYDLERQKDEKIKEDKLSLYIGKENEKVTVAFNFIFREIISKVLNTFDDNGNPICPYKINFKNVTFNKRAYFYSATFTGDADFRKVIFTKNADFREATFRNNVVFIATTFHKRVLFTHLKIENSLIFNNIKLRNKSYISFNSINLDAKKKKFTELKNSQIEIINTVINDRIDFINVGIEKINFNGSNIMGEGIMNRINLKANCANW